MQEEEEEEVAGWWGIGGGQQGDGRKGQLSTKIALTPGVPPTLKPGLQ